MNTEKTKVALDKKSISAIANQVEAKLNPQAASNVNRRSSKLSANGERRGKGLFFWGAASGVAAAIVAPLFTKQAKPVVRGAIKGGLLASRYVQRAASSVKEDMQDWTAEARADLEAESRINDPAGRRKVDEE